MKFALVNPNWAFQGSIYFGCREPHLPLEYGYAKALLERDGHQALVLDGHLLDLSNDDIRNSIDSFKPDFIVVTTAPSYLFWRCPPPELRLPGELLQSLRGLSGMRVVVGPHGSSSPSAVLKKLGADVVIRGEFEDVLSWLARSIGPDWQAAPSCFVGPGCHVPASPHFADVKALPALRWQGEYLRRHRHHHHRFDVPHSGSAAEVETSRGCPFHCLFCAKENFRNGYRRRPVEVICDELDGLIAQGVAYVYFIDELFVPDERLLHRLRERDVCFGIQTRIDLWSRSMLELLGSAGCVSLEAGVESITESGRRALYKPSLVREDDIIHLLRAAKEHIAFVQANLIKTDEDMPRDIARWRSELRKNGIWANEPIPVFPYPGSPLYAKLWGQPDERAWERAHDYYISASGSLSEIQDQHPLPLHELEQWCHV